jgi:DNA-binding Lrp family transcriptional regulator
LDAFIFIQTHLGRAARVADQVRAVEGVTEAVVVSGPCDVIARLRVPDLDHLHGLLSDRLRAVEGILRVLPSVVVPASMRERT